MMKQNKCVAKQHNHKQVEHFYEGRKIKLQILIFEMYVESLHVTYIYIHLLDFTTENGKLPTTRTANVGK